MIISCHYTILGRFYVFISNLTLLTKVCFIILQPLCIELMLTMLHLIFYVFYILFFLITSFRNKI